MARTVGQLVARVQEVLQDAGGVRYPPEQLVAYMNDAVLEARSVRPDLFVGAYDVPIEEVTDLEAPFPLPDQFFPAVCYYVSGRAELRDDEFAVDGRAATLLASLARKLVSGA